MRVLGSPPLQVLHQRPPHPFAPAIAADDHAGDPGTGVAAARPGRRCPDRPLPEPRSARRARRTSPAALLCLPHGPWSPATRPGPPAPEGAPTPATSSRPRPPRTQDGRQQGHGELHQLGAMSTKRRVVALERDRDGGGGAVAVLGDDEVGLAGARRLASRRRPRGAAGSPCRRPARSSRTRAGRTACGRLSRALLGATVELAERDDRDLELLGQQLQRAGELARPPAGGSRPACRWSSAAGSR